jgi:ABC-type branched-subunit amino acid transport system substrate-binding protein
VRKHLSVAIAVVACAGLLTVVGPTAVAGASSAYPPIPAGPITFGISAPTSGALASYGILTKIQTGIALQQFDMMHPNGIDGHQVKLDIENDASDVTHAVQVANQMVSSKDAAVITASYNPAAAGQQLAVWTKAKMPVVANLELTNTLTPAQLATQYPYLFSPNPSLQQTGVAAINWIKQKGFKNVGILNDGIPYDTVFATQISNGVQSIKGAKVTTVNITPGSVDNSAAITKLKGDGAQLLVVTAGEGYGPIWQSVQSANWSPTILASAGAWYSGFDSMGSLTAKASAYYYNCADTATQTFTAVQNQLMAAYSAGTNYPSFVNYLTSIATDSIPLEILNYAITKYHSTDPAAIKKAIEGITSKEFLGLSYKFSTTNHFGLVGSFGPAVCQMGPPYAGGVGRVPVKSSGS